MCWTCCGYVPGLDVVQTGPPGGFTSIFLRGGNSQHTKVLLDGVPLNDPSNAGRSFDFSTLTVDNIEQIEIVRGPQSLLYGSDAIGGVVNIITRKGQGPLRGARRADGRQLRHDAGAVPCSAAERIFTTIRWGAATSIRPASRRPPAGWGTRRKTATATGRCPAGSASRHRILLEAEYIFRYTDAAVDIDDFDFFTGLPFDNFIRQNLSDILTQRVQARHLLLDGAVENRVAFSVADYDRFDTDSGPFLDPLFQGQTRKVEWLSNTRLAEWNTFTVAADYFEEEALSTSVPLTSQNDAGFWLQDQISLTDRWFATAGHRWDDHSAAGHAETYRVTTRYIVPETGTSFHGSIGTGFRAPSLAENFFPFGNPNLRPETSKGWDYGLEQSLLLNRLILGATYFRNDFNNLIIFDPTTFILDNIGSALATGVEITGLARVNDCTDVSLTYTHTDTRDRDTGLALLRRPRDKASLVITRRLLCDRARANLYLLYVGPRRDTRVTLDEYVTVNASGTYDWNDHIQLFGRLDNLFDEQYEEVNGFATAGASAYGGVNVTW